MNPMIGLDYQIRIYEKIFESIVPISRLDSVWECETVRKMCGGLREETRSEIFFDIKGSGDGKWITGIVGLATLKL